MLPTWTLSKRASRGRLLFPFSFLSFNLHLLIFLSTISSSSPSCHSLHARRICLGLKNIPVHVFPTISSGMPFRKLGSGHSILPVYTR